MFSAFTFSTGSYENYLEEAVLIFSRVRAVTPILIFGFFILTRAEIALSASPEVCSGGEGVMVGKVQGMEGIHNALGQHGLILFSLQMHALNATRY